MKANKRVRRNFGTVEKLIDKPHLIEMQLLSYAKFLQADISPDDREDVGLQGVYQSVFPIQDFNGLCSLEFVSYEFGEPKYKVSECIERGMTYEAPIKITVRLVTYDVDSDTEVKSVKDIKEQSVYLGSMPLMTRTGVFVINGTERVIVSQLQRSPGLFYAHDNGKAHSSGKPLYSARIIPVRGSWMDLEFDTKNLLYVRIDRRRKFPVTTLLKALGYSVSELLSFFYDTERIFLVNNRFTKTIKPSLMIGHKSPYDIVNPETGEVIVKQNRKIGKATAKRLEKAGISSFDISREDIIGKYLATDVVSPQTGEVIVQANDEITEELLDTLLEKGIEYVDSLYIDGIKVSDSFRRTLELDKVTSPSDALLEIYRRLRPSSPPTQEVAENFFYKLFFDPETYDISEVGRFKIN